MTFPMLWSSNISHFITTIAVIEWNWTKRKSIALLNTRPNCQSCAASQKLTFLSWTLTENAWTFCKSPLSIFQLYRNHHLFSLSLHNNLKTTAPSPIAGHSPLPAHFSINRGWNFLHRSSEKLIPLGIMGTQARTQGGGEVGDRPPLEPNVEKKIHGKNT